MMKATMIAAAMASSAMGAQFVMYTPGGDDTAVERMDSIVSPGTISAHVHQIFGANKMSPDMTYEELLKSDCTTMGNAAGEGNAADKSVYWHPSGFMEAKDGSGYIRIPTNGHKLYYRDVGNDADKKREPFEFPAGFRMVAGDQTRRAANEDVKRQNITQWVCHNTGPWNQGTDGGFPSDYPDCPSFPGFNGAIHFPHCWNGEDFDQANPGAHVSYPDGDIQGGPCPSSHPIRLPHIFMETQFDLHKMVDKVKPNTFVLAQGDATGYGWHADFMNGWESGAIPELFDSCPQPYYGNADIGTCPTFKKFSTKTRDCKLKVTYEEEVDNSEFLPGCNPIQTTNPATKMQIAKQGVCSNQCQKASGSSASAPSYSAPKADDSSDKTPAKESPAAPQYTTLATYAKSDNDAAPTPSSYAGNVVFETAYVTVTADSYKRDAAPLPGPARHQHAHRHIHKRHGKL